MTPGRATMRGLSPVLGSSFTGEKPRQAKLAWPSSGPRRRPAAAVVRWVLRPEYPNTVRVGSGGGRLGGEHHPRRTGSSVGAANTVGSMRSASCGERGSPPAKGQQVACGDIAAAISSRTTGGNTPARQENPARTVNDAAAQTKKPSATARWNQTGAGGRCPIIGEMTCHGTPGSPGRHARKSFGTRQGWSPRAIPVGAAVGETAVRSRPGQRRDRAVRYPPLSVPAAPPGLSRLEVACKCRRSSGPGGSGLHR